MRENEKGNGLTVGILIALVVVVLAALGVGSLGIRRYQMAREAERRAQMANNLAQIAEALAKSVVIIGEVQSLEPASNETPIHAAPASVKAPFWIVKFVVLEAPGSVFPSESCNILVHSPQSELGVDSVGQRVRVFMRHTNSPPELVDATPDELSNVVYAEPGSTLELISHEPME
jgi:hypothetical protein